MIQINEKDTTIYMHLVAALALTENMPIAHYIVYLMDSDGM